MKKIKRKKDVYETIIVIMLVIVALGLIWVVVKVVVKDVNEPHFKITKEECWNDVEIRTIGEKNLSEINLMDLENNKDNLVYECHFYGCWIQNWTSKEICEPIEVDEFCYWHEDLEDSLLQEGAQIGGCEWIKKKDLSIDLLDENCECYDEEENFVTLVFNKEDCPFEGACALKGLYECPKYKCGDYQVEVWNQIK